MRTKRKSRDPRTRRAKRALRRLSDPPSQRTLKSLKNLSYRDLKALSSEQLQKYKRGLHIIDQEGNPYTDEALRKKLRPYISAGSKKGGGKKTKKKGSKKLSKETFKKMISEMEQSVQADHKKCNTSCDKIKTNYAKDKKKLQLKQKCNHDCWKKRMKTVKGFHKKYPKEFEIFVKNLGGGGKSAYFEFKKGPSKKFWRIVKDGSKLTTHYGRIGSLGQTTTKDYGSKVNEEYEKLIQSKKKKGYVEKTDYGVSNRATSIEREYMKVCQKAEKSKVLNPNQVNADCEGMLDQGEKELKWMTKWHKDALKKGEYNWDKYEDHYKSRKKK